MALSSRNNLLSKKNKYLASHIYNVLNEINLSKENLNEELITNKKNYLTKLGFDVDYLTACDPSTLEDSFEIYKSDILIAVAAKLGDVRLIDNILLSKL